MPTLLRQRRHRRAVPNPQAQSPLFSKLPAELRLRVFGLAVHCSPIPLAAQGPRNRLALALQTPGICGPRARAVRAARLLSLLLACTRAHGEALPLLYGGSNTFAVGDPAAVRLLAAGVGAPWLAQLDFSWTLSKPPPLPLKGWAGYLRRSGSGSGSGLRGKDWEVVWGAVTGFGNLRWLRVELSVPPLWTSEWRESEAEILKPLEDLATEGAHRELILSWEQTVQQGMETKEMLKGWVVKHGVGRPL